MSAHLKNQLAEGDSVDPAAVQDRDRRAAAVTGAGAAPRRPRSRPPRRSPRRRRRSPNAEGPMASLHEIVSRHPCHSGRAGRDLRPCGAEGRGPRARWRIRVRLPAAADQAVVGAGDASTFRAARQAAKGDPADITGSVHGAAEGEKRRQAGDARRRTGRSPMASWSIPIRAQPVSPSERAILERLQARRQELERARAKSRSARACSRPAEKRIEGRVEEMKATEARISDRDRAEGRSRRRALQGHHHHV